SEPAAATSRAVSPHRDASPVERQVETALHFLRAQECLDGATLVHRAIAFRHSIEWQREIEHLARMDRSVQREIDQLREVTAHRGGAAMQPDMRVEQLLAIQRNTVWHADVSDASAGSGGVKRLTHRLVGAEG